MNLQEMLKALTQKIENFDQRSEEIKVELRKKDLSSEDFEKYSKEIGDIAVAKIEAIKERESVIAQLENQKQAEQKIAEQRQAQSKIEKEKNQMNLTKRQAYSLLIGTSMRKKTLNEEEKRAVDVALGTTATTYVAPSANADGVSNFGVLINTKTLTDLLVEDPAPSPILNDVLLYNIKGMTSFPYRKQRTTANKKVEGKSVADASWEWGTVEGKKGWLQSTLKITEEVFALTDIDLGNYVIGLMLSDMKEDFATELLYGNGQAGDGDTTPARIKGITNGATAITATKATIFTDLVNAFTALPKKYKNGAKFYVAEDVYEALALAKDTAGHYIYDVKSYPDITILGRKVEVEPNLVDGGVLIGNVTKYYKGNLLRDVTIEQDKAISTQVRTFVASVFACGAPVPSAFAYGVVSNS